MLNTNIFTVYQQTSPVRSVKLMGFVRLLRRLPYTLDLEANCDDLDTNPSKASLGQPSPRFVTWQMVLVCHGNAVLDRLDSVLVQRISYLENYLTLLHHNMIRYWHQKAEKQSNRSPTVDQLIKRHVVLCREPCRCR